MSSSIVVGSAALKNLLESSSKSLLACDKTLISTFSALRRFRLGVRICPAAENTGSQGAADAGVASHLFATYLASLGHLLSFCFQKLLKLNSSGRHQDSQNSKYSVTSSFVKRLFGTFSRSVNISDADNDDSGKSGLGLAARGL